MSKSIKNKIAKADAIIPVKRSIAIVQKNGKVVWKGSVRKYWKEVGRKVR